MAKPRDPALDNDGGYANLASIGYFCAVTICAGRTNPVCKLSGTKPGQTMVKDQYFWLALGFFLMTAEVVTPGFILFFFGLAAVLVGVLCFILPLSLTMQLLLFAGFAVVSLLTLRKQMKAIFTGRSRDGAGGLDDACIGRHAVVTARIATPADGKVELNGVSWSASAGEVLEAGVPVEVIGREGLTLTVRRRS